MLTNFRDLNLIFVLCPRRWNSQNHKLKKNFFHELKFIFNFLPDASDGIVPQVRSVSCKLRPGLLVLLGKAHTVPLVGQSAALPLPKLKKCDGCTEKFK